MHWGKIRIDPTHAIFEVAIGLVNKLGLRPLEFDGAGLGQMEVAR
jgi:hypothetical protein